MFYFCENNSQSYFYFWNWLFYLKDVFVVCDHNPDDAIGSFASFLYKND